MFSDFRLMHVVCQFIEMTGLTKYCNNIINLPLGLISLEKVRNTKI